MSKYNFKLLLIMMCCFIAYFYLSMTCVMFYYLLHLPQVVWLRYIFYVVNVLPFSYDSWFNGLMQKLIFEKPPPDVRKIVLATNMAETSITINDVVFVVDCGKAKETSYDALNNTPCLLPTWISKASAQQVRYCTL